MYLLDTNVVSELRKANRADANVRRWAERQSPAALYLSAISLLELEIGVLLAERRDRAQGKMLRSWLETRVLPAFADRVLPIDTDVVRRCAPLHVPDPHTDRDALIAATALVHSLIVATRNASDFRRTGVQLINPWEAQAKS